MSWADLFERAGRYEPTVDDVRAALVHRRESEGDGETGDSRGDERGQEDEQ
jgi:hypothetical protein